MSRIAALFVGIATAALAACTSDQVVGRYNTALCDNGQEKVACNAITQKAVAFAKEWGLISLIDNTFASPILQKPIQLGFNIVLHSATKYLSGHSDLIAGAAAGSRAIINEVRHNIINLGGSLDPEAAYLLIRGMKTLGLRMERQCENAMIVAKST